jgi:hypothetical protein
MVAQQILVLSVKVRILVGQQTSGNFGGFLFLYMTRLIPFLIFIFLGVGCTQSVDSLVKDWELTHHQISVGKVLKKCQPEAFTASDSLLILKNIYFTDKRNIETILRQQEDSFSTQIKKAKMDIQLTTNPAMKEALTNGIKSLEYKQQKLRLIDSVYRMHPELTRLHSYIVRMEQYTQNTGILLGYSIEMEFSGQQGLLPVGIFHKKYLLDTNQKKILGEFIAEEK